MSVERERLLAAVAEGRVSYERRQTGDVDMSRYYRHIWHIDGRSATAYQTHLLDGLTETGEVMFTSPFAIGAATVAVEMRGQR